MPTLIHSRVRESRAGTNPKTVCRVGSGWVVLGDVQVVRGYSLLLPDPVVASLNDLPGADRVRFLSDMALLGDALLAVTAARRVNYEVLGNTEAALHAHVFPRYADEPADRRGRPAWFYDWSAAPPFDAERDRPLMKAIRGFLTSAGACV